MPSPSPIDNSADYISPRDIQLRIWELEYLDDPETLQSPEDHDLWEDEITELAQLRELFSDMPDGQDTDTLIRESAFESYAREYAEDTGAIGRDAGWPWTCIDWEEAAEELRADFSSVEFDGVTYYHR